MKIKYLLLVGVSLIAVIVLGYSYGSPNQPNGSSTNQELIATETEREVKALKHKKNTSDSGPIVAYAGDDRQKTDLGTNENQYKESQDEGVNPSIGYLIESLASREGGLSDKSAEKVFRLKNFDSLVYQLESTEANQEFERQFRSSVQDVVQSNIGMLSRSIGCNDKVCAAVVDYSQKNSPERFSKQLIERIKQPISIVMQPVEVNGVKELRVLLNYESAKIIVE